MATLESGGTCGDLLFQQPLGGPWKAIESADHGRSFTHLVHKTHKSTEINHSHSIEMLLRVYYKANEFVIYNLTPTHTAHTKENSLHHYK